MMIADRAGIHDFSSHFATLNTQNFKGYKAMTSLLQFYKGLNKMLLGDFIKAAKAFEEGANESTRDRSVYLIGYGNYLRGYCLSRVNKELYKQEIAQCKQAALAQFTPYGFEHEVIKISETL
jgi:hypothetical protein